MAFLPALGVFPLESSYRSKKPFCLSRWCFLQLWCPADTWDINVLGTGGAIQLQQRGLLVELGIPSERSAPCLDISGMNTAQLAFPWLPWGLIRAHCHEICRSVSLLNSWQKCFVHMVQGCGVVWFGFVLLCFSAPENTLEMMSNYCSWAS